MKTEYKNSLIGMLNSDGLEQLQIVTHLNDLEKHLPIVQFFYNNKKRIGILIGDDPRPGTNNIAIHVLMNGHYQTFNKAKIENMKKLALISDFL